MLSASLSALASPPPELVSLLEQLPGCRLLIDRHYRIVAANSAFREHCHHSHGQAVIGRRCYEVSHGYDAPCDTHGEPCPLRTARESGAFCVNVLAAGQAKQAQITFGVTGRRHDLRRRTKAVESMLPSGAWFARGDALAMGLPAPVRKLLNMVLLLAIKDHASDIHFEPFEDEFRIRIKADGVLFEIQADLPDVSDVPDGPVLPQPVPAGPVGRSCVPRHRAGPQRDSSAPHKVQARRVATTSTA